MQILPVQVLTKEDTNEFGSEGVNLGILKRATFCLPEGVVVNLPYLTVRELEKLSFSKDFDKLLPQTKIFYLDGHFFKDKEGLKKYLKKNWLDEINLNLKKIAPQVIWGLNKKGEKVEAYFDPEVKEVVMQSDKKLPEGIIKKVDEYVLSAGKKLFLPFVYHFLLIDNKELFLVALAPYTQITASSPEKQIVIPKKEVPKLRSAVKVFAGTGNRLSSYEECDGVIFKAEAFSEFDDRLLKLLETLKTYQDKIVIFCLPELDFQESQGVLTLLSHRRILEEAVKTFLFVRNKKGFLNAQLGIPSMRSCREIIQLNKELSLLGVARKGGLKFWLNLSLPENLINLTEYLKVGVDGVTIDLDSLERSLGGVTEKQRKFYPKDTKTLIRFLEPAIKILHENKVLFLGEGGLALNSDMLDFLVEKGVYGLVIEHPLEIQSFGDHLRWVEKRMIVKRLS